MPTFSTLQLIETIQFRLQFTLPTVMKTVLDVYQQRVKVSNIDKFLLDYSPQSNQAGWLFAENSKDVYCLFF